MTHPVHSIYRDFPIFSTVYEGETLFAWERGDWETSPAAVEHSIDVFLENELHEGKGWTGAKSPYLNSEFI